MQHKAWRAEGGWRRAEVVVVVMVVAVVVVEAAEVVMLLVGTWRRCGAENYRN